MPRQVRRSVPRKFLRNSPGLALAAARITARPRILGRGCKANGSAAVRARISRFRRITGKHPDEFELPGVTLDLQAYLEDQRFIARMIGE